MGIKFMCIYIYIVCIIPLNGPFTTFMQTTIIESKLLHSLSWKGLVCIITMGNKRYHLFKKGKWGNKRKESRLCCNEGDCYITFVRRPANKVGCHAFARRSCLFASPFVWMELLFYDCNDALQ